MPQVTVGSYPIAYQALELGHLREPSGSRARIHDFTGHANVEDASPARDKRDFAQIIGKRGEEFLGSPARPQQPSALVAEFDFHARPGHGRGAHSVAGGVKPFGLRRTGKIRLCPRPSWTERGQDVL